MFRHGLASRTRGWRVVTVAGAVIAVLGTSMATAVAQPAAPASRIRTTSVVSLTRPASKLDRSGVKPAQASVSFVGSWPPGSAATTCHFVDLIGARGSGEPAGGQFHGLGAPVNKMISVVQSQLKNNGYSYSTFAVNYPALSVTVLKPNSAQIFAWETAMMNPAGAAQALVDYFNHQVKRYLGSISQGVSATVAKAKSLHRSCGTTLLVFAGYSQGAMVVHQALLKLLGSVTTCVKGALLLADGNRVSKTKAMEYGTSLARGEGIETWIKQTAKVGPTPHDIPRYVVGNTANICNKSDFVCDFNFFTGIHWSRGFKVHTSYAVEKNGRFTYQPVLSSAADAVGGNVVLDLIHHGQGCS
jgi:predicted esterase